MSRSGKALPSFFALGLAIASAANGGEARPVSPGAAERAVEIASACPTFSWGEVEGASAYRLALFETDAAGRAERLYAQRIDGAALAWTPPRERCLVPGGEYAWVVRAEGAGGEEVGAWSVPLRFRVAGEPSAEELREALGVLERWRTHGSDGAEREPDRSAATARSHRRPRSGLRVDGPTAIGEAAIRGESADVTGNAYGVLGISHSPSGAGLVARNEAGGADLILDGEAQGQADTLLRHGGIDRPSASAQDFDIGNSGGGGISLSVGGVAVDTVTTPIGWARLTAVPPGFADGVDDDTTYTAGDGLDLVGTQFRMRGTSYENVVVVAKSGGDFTTIAAALASITTNSASNRFLVWVGPGTYAETVTMKEYVDIEGAGELATRISFTGSAANTTGTVVGASEAELRFLTVENTGGTNSAIAIYNGSAAPRLTHVTARASGAVENYGVYDSGSSPAMTEMTIDATGGTWATGVMNADASSPAMSGLRASATGASARNSGVWNASGSSPAMTNLAATATTAGNSAVNCGVRNESASAPTMTGVTATGANGAFNSGVCNTSSSPSMTNVLAVGSATVPGAATRGVHNTSGSAPVMIQVVARASGSGARIGIYNESGSAPVLYQVVASGSIGVRNDSSSVTIRDSTIDGGSGTGIENSAASGAYVVTVDNSQIIGVTRTVSGNPSFATRIGASKLDGGTVFAAGTITCTYVFDETYTGYASTCP